MLGGEGGSDAAGLAQECLALENLCFSVARCVEPGVGLCHPQNDYSKLRAASSPNMQRCLGCFWSPTLVYVFFLTGSRTSCVTKEGPALRLPRVQGPRFVLEARGPKASWDELFSHAFLKEPFPEDKEQKLKHLVRILVKSASSL